MSLSRNIWLAGLLALASSPAWAQTTAAQQASECTPSPVAFRSVSIHASKYLREHLDDSAEGLSLSGVSVRNLVEYVLHIDRIEGLPKWAMHERYDVTATIDPQDCCRWLKESWEQRTASLQTILQEQLKLTWHQETRTAPGFALVVGRKGPRFAAAQPGKGDTSPYGTGVSYQDLNWMAISMEEFARFLSIGAGHPVIDETGLPGRYQIHLASRWCCGATGYGSLIEADGTPIQPSGGPSIFDDVRMLGLKLEPKGKVPVNVLVIDRVERPNQDQ